MNSSPTAAKDEIYYYANTYLPNENHMFYWAPTLQVFTKHLQLPFLKFG